MAKVNLNIEADGLEDLASTLSGMMYLSAYRPEAGTPANEAEESAQEGSEPGKRRRRAKAEMEAAKAAEVQGTTGSVASSVFGGGTAMEAGSGDTGAATIQTIDPFSDQLKAVQAEEALMDDTPAVTKEDVKAAMGQCIEKIGAGKTQLVLKQHANNAGTLGAVDPKFYPAVLAALKAELA